MKAAREIRVGNLVKIDGKLYKVLKAEFHKSTSGRRASASEIKFRFEDLTGNRRDMAVEATEKMDNIILESRMAQFMYNDGSYNFMDQESFEQFSIDDIGDAAKYIVEEDVVEISFYEGKPLSVILPKHVTIDIKHTDPGLRGDTTGKATKPATLASGFEIQVPLFCSIGEKIVVDTENDKYVERAKS